MTRRVQALTALVLALAMTVAGPIGSGAAAGAGAAGSTRGQESQLERAVDALPAAQRVELERHMTDQLKAAGLDLTDPKIQAKLAQILGVGPTEIAGAIGESNARLAGAVGGPPAAGILLLFVAASLIFAPSVFQSVGGALYGALVETRGIEGIEAFGG